MNPDITTQRLEAASHYAGRASALLAVTLERRKLSRGALVEAQQALQWAEYEIGMILNGEGERTHE